MENLIFGIYKKIKDNGKEIKYKFLFSVFL